MEQMHDRQHAINELYRAYRDAGFTDTRTRHEITEFVDRILAVDDPSKILSLETYLRNASPLLEAELDAAREAYEKEAR